VQTMLTVVTQNSRLLRRSALSGDRMAGFAYPALVRARGALPGHAATADA
jgi:hypothetical protein